MTVMKSSHRGHKTHRFPKDFCRHCMYDVTDVRRGIGDGGSEAVDIDRWKCQGTTDATEFHIHREMSETQLVGKMHMVQNKSEYLKFVHDLI
jgi:hypothetical protein